MKSPSVLYVHVEFSSPDVRAKRRLIYAVGRKNFEMISKSLYILKLI